MTIAGKNVMILVANGFDESQMTEIQKALTKVKANIKTIAPEQGLVNGWQGSGWGHYFPVDTQINEALGSDYDILVVPGGERGTAKLKTNLHTRRIISHFLEAGKPVAAVASGVGLLALTNKVSGLRLSASTDVHEVLAAAGVIVSEDTQETDANVLTASGSDIQAWVDGAMELFATAEDDIKQAA
jgi:protease I